ncbi:Two-component transcriptional response regulator, LuxR family [hydrothermal vent metagenome]|uniref:Two-component transcriptional response regulator, LuxR family n=1 Tax=hydrothermal vent metagenome TaxID=652676 RepID=A0A3B0ZV14_9ZZZZ
MNKEIAIVEDDPIIGANYLDALRKQGFSVQLYSNRNTATVAFKKKLPDLVLLDIGLEDEPDGGFELCRALRAQSATLTIIFLTARDSDLDTISGLRLGADDYLTKEVSIPNLCARVSAFFRRMDAYQTPDLNDQILHRGELDLDKNRFSIKWKNQAMELTLTEFWMIHALVRYPGHVRSREQLMHDAKIVVDDATITSHIKRIRNKFLSIDPSFTAIDTVYGIGYRWLHH